MKRLTDYVERMMRYARLKNTSAQSAEEYMHNAFGACEMFICLYGDCEYEVVTKWNLEWKNQFEKIIQEKYN